MRRDRYHAFIRENVFKGGFVGRARSANPEEGGLPALALVDRSSGVVDRSCSSKLRFSVTVSRQKRQTTALTLHFGIILSRALLCCRGFSDLVVVKQVGHLEVSVNDPSAVQVLDSLQELDHDALDLLSNAHIRIRNTETHTHTGARNKTVTGNANRNDF